MHSILQDLQFALRQLRRSPGFALVAIATLALAIGVSTSVFSVIEATVVRPLPFHDPDRIVELQTRSPQGYGQPASWPMYQDWRHQNSTLSALAGFLPSSANLEWTAQGAASSGAAPIRAVYGTDNFFDVFEVKPILGRTFLPGEDQNGRNDVVVLSYELWQQSFAGRADILGTTVKVDGIVNTVIGVMPAGFRYPLGVVDALYRPFHLSEERKQRRNQHFMPTIGRLKAGVSLATAQADLTQVFTNLGRAYPDEAGGRVALATLADATLGSTAAPLRVLTLAVFGVLLIGCINLAGLLLARGVRRQRELSLRSAVGAGRSRLVRQLLTEAAVLSLAGGAAGILLAAGLLQAMRQLLVHSLARGADVQLNLPVLAATFAIAIVTGVAAGALPALQSSRISPSLALRSGGAAGTSRGQNRLRSSLIATQVAIALGLLVCSGLLLRNLHGLRSTDLGFSPDNLLSAEIFVTPSTYEGRDLLTSFYQPLLTQVRAIPGVQSAGLINMLPIQDWGSNSDIRIVGKPMPPIHQEQLAENRFVTPDVLETLGAHLVSGRIFDPTLDRKDTALSVVVNQALVRKFFAPGENPVARQIDWGGIKLNIIGVTTDLRQSLSEPPRAEMDILASQIPDKYAVEVLTRMSLVIRTTVPPASIAGPLRDALHHVDPGVPFRVPLTMHQVIAETLIFERLESWLFSIFAALALLLSLVGIYGMVHLEVELRTRDIGVRMALGSTRARVLGQIVTRVALLMLYGIGLGWLLTLGLRRAISSVVELHAAHDALLLTLLTLTLGLCGVAASLLPARRAASIDPMQALRSE
jgi:putative ABC transport system permease protein